MKRRGGAGRRRPMTRAELLARNPVANAGAVDELRDSMRVGRLHTYELQDGEDATQALAYQGYHLALAAQTALKALGTGDPLTRRLHTALRNVHAMCTDHGYRWRAALAPVIEPALAEAVELLLERPTVARQWEPAASVYHDRILAHQVARDDVAGAELYRAQPVQAQQHQPAEG